MYRYEDHKQFVFSEEGQVRFLKIRDRAGELLKLSGAVRLDRLLSGITGDSWQTLACFDRLVELGELEEVTAGETVTQLRVYVSTKD